MVQVAQEHIRSTKQDETISFQNGSAEDSDLIASLGKFDVVYSTFSLHHWPDPLLGISNLLNSLSDSGVLYIYDFYRGGLFYYLKIKRDVWESIRASYTSDEISSFLNQLGVQSFTLERKGLYLDFIMEKQTNII